MRINKALKAVLVSMIAVTALAASGEDRSFDVQRGEKITIGTWNVKWFFDHDKSDNESDLSHKQSAKNARKYKTKVQNLAKVIARIKPTALGLQEVEDKDVVDDLAEELKRTHNLNYKTAFIQGRDSYTEQDVAFLIEDRPGKITVSRAENSGINFRDRNRYKIPSKHAAVTVTRRTGNDVQSLTVINCHLKAGTKPSEETQRKKQSRVLKKWADELIEDGHAVIILGDFNASKSFPNPYRDAMGVLRGLDSRDSADDLEDLHGEVRTRYRSTHVTNRQLDRIVVSQNLLDDEGLVFKSIRTWQNLVSNNASDHYPLVATFEYR